MSWKCSIREWSYRLPRGWGWLSYHYWQHALDTDGAYRVSTWVCGRWTLTRLHGGRHPDEAIMRRTPTL